MCSLIRDQLGNRCAQTNAHLGLGTLGLGGRAIVTSGNSTGTLRQALFDLARRREISVSLAEQLGRELDLADARLTRMGV